MQNDWVQKYFKFRIFLEFEIVAYTQQYTLGLEPNSKYEIYLCLIYTQRPRTILCSIFSVPSFWLWQITLGEMWIFCGNMSVLKKILDLNNLRCWIFGLGMFTMALLITSTSKLLSLSLLVNQSEHGRMNFFSKMVSFLPL